jgi:hypothetical protein
MNAEPLLGFRGPVGDRQRLAAAGLLLTYNLFRSEVRIPRMYVGDAAMQFSRVSDMGRPRRGRAARKNDYA